MKNVIINISLFVIIGIIAFFAGRYSKKSIEKIKIVKETKTEFKYIKDVKTEKELLECYKSTLELFASVKNDNWIEIIARDDCKIATKKIQVKSEQKKNFIYTNIGYKSIQINYYRRFGNFMIGGGVSYPGNVYVGAGYNF